MSSRRYSIRSAKKEENDASRRAKPPIVETNAKSDLLGSETLKDEIQGGMTTDEIRGTIGEDGVAIETIEGDATIVTEEEIDIADRGHDQVTDNEKTDASTGTTDVNGDR